MSQNTTLPDLNPQTTVSGIAIDPKSLERVVPSTRRADGSVRKELKIRPGFTPQEDLTRFKGTRQTASEKNTIPKGHILGWVPPSSETRTNRGGKGGASSSGGGRSLEALASGEISFTGAATNADNTAVSKSAKKNAKRAEKKKEDKQKALEEKIRAAWDDDSEDDIPRPAKKGKAPAVTGSQEETPASGSQGDAVEGDNGLANRVGELNI